MLQISVPNGILDLPPDVELSIDEVNVLWSDETSHSLPVKVSYTNNNLALLGHPERCQNATHEINLPCTVTHTNFYKRGLITFVSIDNEEKIIEFSMLLDEAVWFEWAKKTKLKDIEWPQPIVVRYNTAGTPDVVFKAKKEALDALTDGGWGFYGGSKADYYAAQTYNRLDPEVYWSMRKWCAELDTSMVNSPTAEFTDCAFVSAIKEWDQTHDHEYWDYGNSITYHMAKYDVVNKYGLYTGAATPLLFIRTILKYLFKGWIVTGNPFLNGDLCRAFVFNDNITFFENGSIIDYSKLVPDETIEAFITVCENISGTRLVIDPINQIVKFESLKNKLISDSIVIQTPLTVNTKEVSVNQFVLTSNVIDCDYAKMHEDCNESLILSKRCKTYDTINYQHVILRDKGDAGRPWESVKEYPEQVVFDKAMQCFGIEKWERKEADKWIFKREFLGNRFYPKKYGTGSTCVNKDIDNVAINVVIPFLQYFYDSNGVDLNNEANYVMHLPFYPCRYESANDYMHDYERLFFGPSETRGKIGVSIQRGLHALYVKKGQFEVMIKQDGTRDTFRSYGAEVMAWTDNKLHFKWASSDIYDIDGNPAIADGERFHGLHGRFKPTVRLLSLRAEGENGLFETFYQEVAKFCANQVLAEVPENSLELNRIPIHDKVLINRQEYVIMKRKRSLTLYANVISTTELAAVVQ